MTWSCEHDETTIGLHILTDGSVKVIEQCQYCYENVNREVNGKKVPFLKNSDYDLQSLPVLKDDSPKSRKCAVHGCENVGAQEHHISPKHLFGTEAAKWPTVPLCREHHQEWHSKVTPNMTGK